MEDIIFRAKRKDNDQWVEGFYVHRYKPSTHHRTQEDEYLIINEDGDEFLIQQDTLEQIIGTRNEANEEISSVGGGITQFKMSGNVEWDIDKVYDASCYMVGLVDFLVEEMKARNFDTDTFIYALDVQQKAKQMLTDAEKMRWHEMRKRGKL